MVKVIALIRRRDGMTREEFLRHWQIDHPLYVRRLNGLRRYVQSPAIEHRRTWPYDGVAELWFDSVRDVAAAFDSPEADKMRDHEHHFIGTLEWLLADETEVPIRTSRGDVSGAATSRGDVTQASTSRGDVTAANEET